MAAARTSRRSASCAISTPWWPSAAPAPSSIAEESTAWPGVTPAGVRAAWASPTNGTWAGCTTRCATWSAIRSIAHYHHDDITFGLLYAFSENFILPLSPRRGRARQGLAARQDAGRPLAEASPTCAPISASCGPIPARSCCSWAARSPRSANGTMTRELDWHLLDDPDASPACSGWCATSTGSTAASRRCTGATASRRGFRWIDRRRSRQLRASPSCAWARRASAPVLVVCNMTPVPRHRLSHRRAARRPTGARSPTPIRASTAAATWAMTAAVHALEQPSHGQSAFAADSPCRRFQPSCCAPRAEHGELAADRLLPGRPYPLGATWDGLGVNFAVFSAHATRLELCLFDPAGRREIAALRRCRNAPTRSGTATCPRRAPG